MFGDHAAAWCWLYMVSLINHNGSGPAQPTITSMLVWTEFGMKICTNDFGQAIGFLFSPLLKHNSLLVEMRVTSQETGGTSPAATTTAKTQHVTLISGKMCLGRQNLTMMRWTAMSAKG